MSFVTTDPRENVDIRMGQGAAGLRPITVVEALKTTCEDVPNKIAMRVKRDGM